MLSHKISLFSKNFHLCLVALFSGRRCWQDQPPNDEMLGGHKNLEMTCLMSTWKVTARHPECLHGKSLQDPEMKSTFPEDQPLFFFLFSMSRGNKAMQTSFRGRRSVCSSPPNLSTGFPFMSIFGKLMLL